MILARLKEFADTQMSLPPVMYGEARIRWFIDIDAKGKLLGFVPLGNTNNRDKRGDVFIVPTLVRAAGIKPKLLVDNAEYVLGIARETSNPMRVEQLHSAFAELTKACFAATHDPDVEAVVTFLETLNRDDLTLPEDFDASMNLSFRIHHDANTVIPADHSPANQSIQAFWADYTATGGDEDNRPLMTCLVTGKRGPVEQRLPEKIKGIPACLPLEQYASGNNRLGWHRNDSIKPQAHS
jgi:CRISPR-associated protein Csd1